VVIVAIAPIVIVAIAPVVMIAPVLVIAPAVLVAIAPVEVALVASMRHCGALCQSDLIGARARVPAGRQGTAKQSGANGGPEGEPQGVLREVPIQDSACHKNFLRPRLPRRALAASVSRAPERRRRRARSD
jgi:hypothetical protein